MIRPRRTLRRRGPLSLTRLSPNIITVLALCAGMTGVRFAVQERWEYAVLSIVVAGVLDASDGRLARLLGASSKFGAELDSLSDVIAFGLAPAIILYLWCMQEAGSIGWAISLLYCVCVALRLARFNTLLEEVRPPWASQFFTGVPAPAGAGLVLLPLMLSFQVEDVFDSAILNGIVLLVVSALLVSQIPTFSFKRIRVPQKGVLPLLLGVGLLAAFLVGAPWTTLTVVGLLYAGSIPIGYLRYRRLEQTEPWSADAAPDPAPH